MEKTIELQSGAELSGTESEDIHRGLEDPEAERLDDAVGDGEDDDGMPEDSEEPIEGAAKRSRVDRDVPEQTSPPGWPAGAPTLSRGGPPRNPDGSAPPPPPGFDADGFPIEAR